MMMSSTRGGRSYGEPPVKVVIINTQYVEVDALSFKSIVQRLTGKDAPPPPEEAPPPKMVAYSDNRGSGNYETVEMMSGNNKSELSRGMLSFKDFDKFLMDLPSLDELYQLFVE